LTSADILNGNVLYTNSMAQGTSILDNATVIGVPGASQTSINNPNVDELLLAIPGPTGPPGSLAVVTAACEDAPPHTSLTCSTSNSLELLFCDLSSNSTQIGNIYICIPTSWVFFGNVNVEGNETVIVGPTGPTGPPGIGVYAATCSGGPPPTSVTSPSYTCNSAFNLNMVLCSLSSTNNNAGIVYECLCSPSCHWVAVANLNAAITWINGQTIGQIHINGTAGVYTTLVTAVLPSIGTYQCFFETSVFVCGPTPTQGLDFCISSTPSFFACQDSTFGTTILQTPAQINALALSAKVIVATAPQTIYVPATVSGNTLGYCTSSACNLRCLKIT
jgi:hypothetical protein